MIEIPDANKLVKQAVDQAVSLFGQNRLQEAETLLKQTLKVAPEDHHAMQLLGLTYYKHKKYEDAIVVFKRAIELDPSPENYNNIALAYACIHKVETAIDYTHKAIELDPNSSIYISNLGLQQRQAGNIDEAMRLFKLSLDMNPNESHVWLNLGSVYGQQKKIGFAIESFKRAMELDPSNPHTHVDLAYGYHLNGDIDKAWEEYEWRLQSFEQVKYFTRMYPEEKRLQKGMDVKGKTLVVYCEQGSGDFIQFVRFLPLLKSLGVDVLLHTPEELLTLMQANDYGQKDIAIDFAKSEYDLHCSIMSLPYLFDIKDMSSGPYIKAGKTASFDDYKNYHKIGIVWAGNPRHPNDQNRSCPLKTFRPLFNVKQIEWEKKNKIFSLQKDLRLRAYTDKNEPIDLTEGAEDLKLVDLAPFINDFQDTAAFIEGLDLVITVDTAVLHLAGAIGKPAYAMIPFNPDWRWGIDGDKTIWYPSVKMFRQEEIGNWDTVIGHIAEVL